MSDNSNMPFLKHIEVLRWHFIRSIIAVFICSIIAFLGKNFIFDTIVFGPKDPNFLTYRVLCSISKIIGIDDAMCIDEIPFIIQNRTMTGQFSSHIWVSLISGFIIAFPYVIFELWSFLKPGFSKKEKKYSSYIILSSSFLFMAGVLFGYYLITPLSITFLASYTISPQISNEIDITSYISTISTIVLASAIIFQLPVIVYFLTKIGLLSPSIMKKYNRHVIVVMLIISAVITPPDVASQILVCLPLMALYQFSILICKIVLKREKK
ncbi:twin-arginine translocase subunit TatC [Ichthyobacterium seriolicida]|uniref:Sec-independent protein translocase protein TatC n=1 Tax=Ichthyobacterium seriolicida TaxID=242600 RepID=A0A1J1ED82_9FLAO|nr:twin-arginine translocase subunit TatC [Ichthyobacterium seriolicida]BAV95480.1 twin-arginine translocation protein TatC [Ichthyobacterium seriolicida]